MRNHFLRAKGVPASGGGGGSCGANDTGGTNEWAFTTARGYLLAYEIDYTSSIDTANNVSYHATTQNNKFFVRKITNTGTISWNKEISLSDWTYFKARKGHSLSNGKQIFAGPAQYNNTTDFRIVVVCINADGSINWCRSLESTGTTDLNSSAANAEIFYLDVDGNDNIYLTTTSTYNNTYKLSSAGNLSWFKIYKHTNESGSDLTSVNKPYVTGMVVDNSYIYTLYMRRNHRYGFLQVLNTSDGSVYTKRWITNDSTYSDRDKYWSYLTKPYFPNHLTIDSSSNLYVSYVCYNSSNRIQNLYLAKIDSSLNSIAWSKEYTISDYYLNAGFQGGAGIARTTGNGNIIFAALGNKISNSNYKNIIIGVFNSSGELSWQRNITGHDDQYPHPFRTINSLEGDSADHFYITSSLPWTSSNHGYTEYSFYQMVGESLLKHTTCSAPTANSTFFTSSAGSSLPSGETGWAEFMDDSLIGGEATGDFQISSSAYTNESSYIANISDITTAVTGNYSYNATSHTLSVANISSSDDKKELDHI
tara:strand:+ start:338 stop:1942 length:1605 start_codon:yes stop_codon:yes gene_type:complete